MPTRPIPSLALAGLLIAPAAAEDDPLQFKSAFEPLLYEHCGDCHMDGASKGGMSFDDLDTKAELLEHREMWRKVKEVVMFGDMPPEPEDTDFGGLEVEMIVAWIDAKIDTIDHDDPIYQDPGPAVVRPLTATEYENTIRDLLGVEIDLETEVGITEEVPVEGFSNQAAMLSMDPVVLEKYFLAADKVLERFAADEHADKRREIFPVYPANPQQNGPAAERILTHLASRAYRREVNDQTVRNLGPLFARTYAETQDFDASIAKALKPVLISPMFLFKMEKPVPTEGYEETDLSFRVTDHELAVRLSYFLWATMPDERLMQAAAAGKLSTPEGLRAEVDRMLEDPRALSLADIFAEQWLKLYKLEEALPSPDVYPSFTEELKADMREETRLFVENLIRGDRSVLELLDADYTFLNERLAEHYDIPGVIGDRFRKVELKSEHNRGGLLGMGSFLASTSHTDRTKPTLRGAYILEVVLGTPPTPPPAEVSVFKSEPGEEVVIESFRDQLNAHANDPNCAACHKKIDPLGFALENFDAVGRWFDTKDGQPIDNHGVLPTGEDVSGFGKLQQAIKERQDLYVHNLTRQLMSYALGREISYYDMSTVEKTVARMKENDYRFSSLIHGITESLQFQHRRKITDNPNEP